MALPISHETVLPGLNEGELGLFVGSGEFYSQLERAVQLGPSVAIVTLGSADSLALNSEVPEALQFTAVEAIPVQVVNTTGRATLAWVHLSQHSVKVSAWMTPCVSQVRRQD